MTQSKKNHLPGSVLGVREAPVYRPTEEEFLDPLKFIAGIRHEAEQFGLCRIVPPASWKPPFALHRETFNIRTKVQAIHQLQERPAGADSDTFRLEYQLYCDQQQLQSTWPRFDGQELDLCGLFIAVKRRGGRERVAKEKRWQEVLKMVRPKRQSHSAPLAISALQLAQLYDRHLGGYESYVANPKAVITKDDHSHTPAGKGGGSSGGTPSNVMIGERQSAEPGVSKVKRHLRSGGPPPVLIPTDDVAHAGRLRVEALKLLQDAPLTKKRKVEGVHNPPLE